MRRLARALDAATRGQLVLGLVAAFVISRLGYFALGVRFNDYPLGVYWQFLPVRLLRTRLLESVWHLHAQPPLFNLYLGSVLKLAGDQHAMAFHAVSMLLGLGVLLGGFALMRRLGVRALAAAVLSLGLVTSPAFVAYENWLFYSLPMAFLLLASAFLLEGLLRRGGLAWGGAFFGVLFVIGASRSLFHLAWFVAIVTGLLLARPRLRGTLLRSAALPLLLLLALYAKNAALFGSFGLSSWLGMNLARLSVGEMAQEEREDWIADGRLSPASREVPFSPPDHYPEGLFQVPPRFARVPALASLEKLNESVNFNHYGYLRVSDLYRTDALEVMRHDPGLYLRSVAQAWQIYFRSPSSLQFLGVENRRVLATAFDVYDYACFGRFPWVGAPRGERGEADFSGARYLALLLGLPLLVAFGVLVAVGRAGAGLDSNQRLVVGYLCFNIAWVALFGNLLELGENNRFRFETDPLSLTLLGLLVQRFTRG